MTRPDVAVIVDALSTGKAFPLEFARKGLPSVHVDSGLPPHLACNLQPTDFLAGLDARRGIPALAERVRQAYRPVCVVTGGETAVATADQLAAHLGLPGNAPTTSAWRRDKFAMGQRLGARGLRAVHQARCTTAEAALAWVKTVRGGKYPVVVKLPASAGNEGFRVCQCDQDVRAAFAAHLHQRNLFGLVNDALLVQELLLGTQYTVNSVSWQGRHQITDIWRLKTIYLASGSVIYDFDELLPRRGPVQDRLAAYTCRCLDALGLEHGAGHSEVMDTATGPCLIETAARVQGSVDLASVRAALGVSQLDLLVDLHTDPRRAAFGTDHEYVRRKALRWVQLISPASGLIEEIPLATALRRLPTFSALQLRVAPGQRLQPTIDLFTSPGELFLVGDPANLERDYRIARQLEKHGWKLRDTDSKPVPAA